MDISTADSVIKTTNEIGEWSRKIIEVYMTWYTFFASSNVLAMGWIFGTTVEDKVKPMLKAICFLFFVLNLLGAISTGVVGYTVGAHVPLDFQHLIWWAAIANGIALLGFASVWLYCRAKLQLEPHKHGLSPLP
jgi:hypothetical protein